MMKRTDGRTNTSLRTRAASPDARGSTTFNLLIFGAIVVVGVVAFRFLGSKPAVDPLAGLNSATQPDPSAASQTNPVVAVEPPKPKPASIVLPAPTSSSTSPAPEKPGSTVEAQQLIGKIIQIDPSAGPLTAAQAKELNHSIKQIVTQGKAAVPAIKEFLERNQDLGFTEISGGNPLDFGSLRQGLIDALEKIGGPEAIEVAAKTLETAGDPLEVAMLARNLEKNAPEQFRELELKAAKESFSMALASNSDGHSIYPILELYQRIGDTSVVPDLEKAVMGKTSWRYQAALALSELPDGVGVPALIKLTRNSDISAQDQGDLAYRVLAQVAGKYPDARTALMDQARANQVPSTAWPAIASALSGTYVFSYGYQVFGLPESLPTLTPAQIPQQIAFMDQLINATNDPAAQAALREHRAALATRVR